MRRRRPGSCVDDRLVLLDVFGKGGTALSGLDVQLRCASARSPRQTTRCLTSRSSSAMRRNSSASTEARAPARSTWAAPSSVTTKSIRSRSWSAAACMAFASSTRKPSVTLARGTPRSLPSACDATPGSTPPSAEVASSSGGEPASGVGVPFDHRSFVSFWSAWSIWLPRWAPNVLPGHGLDNSCREFVVLPGTGGCALITCGRISRQGMGRSTTRALTGTMETARPRSSVDRARPS